MPFHTAAFGGALTVVLAAIPATRALSQAPLELPRLSGPIVLDGTPNESAWSAIAPLPLTLHLPVFRGEPTQRTEIRVAYDDENLYVAGWFYDTDPNGVQVHSLYRDRWNGDDALGMFIDAFNDNRNAKWFGVTPSGMRFDQLLSDDGLTSNASWDAFWDARSTITAEGWFSEVRIPFSTLGFRVENGVATMGLTVTRLVSRINERVTFPAIDPRYQYRQPSVMQDVVLRDVRAARPVYVTPYVLSGMEQHPVLPAGGTTFEPNRDFIRDAGLDLRYPISSELTLDVTANTDFAQVEADDEQVNLDRFSLFFPEKRRFFQERSELFDFVMGPQGGRVFHSRQIGLLAGAPIPVIGGVRVVGRAGAWDVGVLNMQTRDDGLAPAENFGVARLRRGVINPYSAIGAILTTRAGDDRHNVAAGVDGVFRVFGDDYLTARIAATEGDAEPAGTSLVDRSQTFVGWRRRATRGLMYEVSSTRSGREYDPRVGFLPRRDFTTANAISEYYFFTDSSRTFRRVWPGALAFSTFRNSDGALESAQYAFWLQWETKQGGGGWIEPKLFHEDVLTPFTIGGEAEIPAGAYTFADLQLALQMRPGARLRTTLDARAGTYFDGTRAQIILSPTWNVSPHLELGADYQHTRLRFGDRDDRANIHLARLRIRTALDSRASANAFVQFNSTTDRLAVNVRLRYNFSEGTDLWLVYDESLATDRTDPTIEPRLPLSAARTLVVKYTRTFQP